MNLSEFARLYPLRCKNLALLCGAGTSVAAGMPSANDLIWEFKRLIYCTEERLPLSLFTNLTSPSLRNQIQAYFSSKESYPTEGSIEEYSFYFEKAFPSEKDRSAFLKQKLGGMQNSFGHRIMGILMKHRLLNIIFTTNFDKAIENAAVDQLKTLDKVFVGTIDNATTTLTNFHSSFHPLIVKLHGDYQSEKLKNTDTELQRQDDQLRSLIYKTCLSQGLLVMGYSGRDRSIMDVLNRTLAEEHSFPNGIFWFNKEEYEPLPAVKNFIQAAKAKGIQAEIINIDTFDSTWAEIIKMFPELPLEDVSSIHEGFYKTVNSQLPPTGRNYPIIRFNGFEITDLPTTARLIQCQIGNTKDVISKIKESKADIIAIRKADGVVGFGSDSEFEKAFSNCNIVGKKVFQIPEKQLSYEDSAMKGLITEALMKALVYGRPLLFRRRKDRYLVMPHPSKINDECFKDLKSIFKNGLTGNIPMTQSQWIVGIELSIQKKLSQYILVVHPTVIASRSADNMDKYAKAAFLKELTARWYNFEYASILDAWRDILFGSQTELCIQPFDPEIIGFNPSFKIKKQSPSSNTL